MNTTKATIEDLRADREQVHYWARDYPHAGSDRPYIGYFDLEDGRLLVVHMGPGSARRLLRGLHDEFGVPA